MVRGRSKSRRERRGSVEIKEEGLYDTEDDCSYNDDGEEEEGSSKNGVDNVGEQSFA